MVFKKIIFQNRYVALETPSRPPPFMANTILNFHFDYLHTSLRLGTWQWPTVYLLPTFPTSLVNFSFSFLMALMVTKMMISNSSCTLRVDSKEFNFRQVYDTKVSSDVLELLVLGHIGSRLWSQSLVPILRGCRLGKDLKSVKFMTFADEF